MTASRRSLVADGQPVDIFVPQRFPRSFGRSARWSVRAQATLRECQRWCGNARGQTENGGLAALGGQGPRAHMRRSRDGGGIRLSCSHVSQTDTRSRSWQVLAANLLRDSVFQVVRCELTPVRHLALEFAQGTRACPPGRPSVGQYGAWPRIALAELGDALAADRALARNPSGQPGPRTKLGAARPVDRALAGIASDLRIAHTKPAPARPADRASTRSPSERHPRPHPQVKVPSHHTSSRVSQAGVAYVTPDGSTHVELQLPSASGAPRP